MADERTTQNRGEERGGGGDKKKAVTKDMRYDRGEMTFQA